MLRRDTFRIIDGAGPSINDQDTSSQNTVQTELSDVKKESQMHAQILEQVAEHEDVENQKQLTTQPKCAFCGVAPIDLQQFLDSSISLVECPDCTSTSSLTPHKGNMQFKPHKRRKTRSTSTGTR